MGKEKNPKNLCFDLKVKIESSIGTQPVRPASQDIRIEVIF